MLKRYQILMNDWLAEYWQVMAEKMDVSFSEMVRLALCKHILDVTPVVFPKFKSKLDEKIFKKIVENRDTIKNLPSDELHAFFSRLYFEAQKASELWAKNV